MQRFASGCDGKSRAKPGYPWPRNDHHKRADGRPRTSLLAIAVRRQIPAQHMEGDSKDVVKLILGLIATLTALVLGLLISSGYSAYQAQQTEVQHSACAYFKSIGIWLNLGRRPLGSGTSFGQC